MIYVESYQSLVTTWKLTMVRQPRKCPRCGEVLYRYDSYDNMAKLLSWIRSGITRRTALCAKAGGHAVWAKNALDRLVQEGIIVKQFRGRAINYTIVEARANRLV